MALCAAGPASAQAAAAPKVLRVTFLASESGFDPPQISDVVSAAIVTSLFDAPLTYDYLARPARLKPNTAVGLPEVHDNHTRFVFTLRPGVFFTDHPAFQGRPRELVAADYVYSIKRYFDPLTRSPTMFQWENVGLLGLSELRKQALATKKPFDYDTEVPGIRALDRYRFEVRVAQPAPRLPYLFATPAVSGAVAREVIEAHPGDTMRHPVGTGPFKLGRWVRSSRIELERNPLHQHSVHDEQPNADDAAGQAIARQMRGRKLPMVDRVEVAIIEEAQPRWLAFLNGELDILWVPPEFITRAAPNNLLAPNLAKQGVQMRQLVMPITRHVYFGMEHPMVGGLTPEKVALRRAVGLAYDVQREIDLVRHGQMVPAQSPIPPGVSGYDPKLRSEMGTHDPARAKALLDLYGYIDRDGDGWRENPDGSPLQLELTTEPTQLARQLQGLWQKSLKAVGVKISFRIGAWPENIKASRAGKLMMWTTGWSAAIPDGTYFMDLLYGPNKGQSNASRFNLPAFNTLHERQRQLPDGPERDALIQQGMKIALAYMPYKASGHDIQTWVMQPRVQGYMPHPFMRDFWRHVDLTPAP
ncbi:bicyclomycin resistance protein [Rubrivivax rivuli]|uniref:Bicyclomycin resistance protein n=2 Tax=Rubrivivax rivuli TaxID=1862385 RepID=A0A437RSX2_9BURK|nr:bicyclomycin resistance protein [Rubrivivax rivuli]